MKHQPTEEHLVSHSTEHQVKIDHLYIHTDEWMSIYLCWISVRFGILVVGIAQFNEMLLNRENCCCPNLVCVTLTYLEVYQGVLMYSNKL